MSAPSVPIISYVQSADKSLIVGFIQRTGTVSKYQYSLNGGAWTDAVGTSSPITISGLTNGLSYTVALQAFNGATPSGASDTTIAMTPYSALDLTTSFSVAIPDLSYSKAVQITATNAGGATSVASNSTAVEFAPAVPIITQVDVSNQKLIVTWTEANTGGISLTKLRYSLNSGAFIDASVASPLVISGLTNGTSYTVKIDAVNAVGDSVDSSTVGPYIPGTTPQPPTSLVATAGNLSASLAFVPPINTGGYAITSYKYSTDGITYVTAAGTTSPITISTLTAKTAYSFYLKSVNSFGESAASVVSNSVTVYTAPSAPTSVTVAPGLHKITVSFTAPADLQGSALQYYKYSVDNGTTYVNTTYTASPFDISLGLVDGTAYTVKLIAHTQVDSAAATSSGSATPYTYPSAPTGVTLTRGLNKLTVAFTAGSNGYGPLQFVKYSLNGGSYVSTSYSASPFDISVNVSAGTSYYVNLIQNNTLDSTASTTSNTVIPYTYPSAPVVTSLIGGFQKLTVKFIQDSSGFADLTGYKYSLNGGAYVSVPSTTSPFDISAGISTGTSYTLNLIASHFVDSTASVTSNAAVPYTTPSAPSITRAVYDGSNLIVTFTSPTNNGGVPITNYSYSIDSGATYSKYYKA